MIPSCRKTHKVRTDLFSQVVVQVFIVTGSLSGVSKELAQILYAHDANVCVAARSKERARHVVWEIRANFPASKGGLVYLHLDLEVLSAIKASAEE
jgi:retinol dehydrogenase 12